MLLPKPSMWLPKQARYCRPRDDVFEVFARKEAIDKQLSVVGHHTPVWLPFEEDVCHAPEMLINFRLQGTSSALRKASRPIHLALSVSLSRISSMEFYRIFQPRQ